MLERIIELSVTRRGLVLSLVAFIGVIGVWSFTRLPIDAVPDITNVQVVVNTAAPGYTPLEVEQRVSFLLENAMASAKLPNWNSRSRRRISSRTTGVQSGICGISSRSSSSLTCGAPTRQAVPYCRPSVS